MMPIEAFLQLKRDSGLLPSGCFFLFLAVSPEISALHTRLLILLLQVLGFFPSIEGSSSLPPQSFLVCLVVGGISSVSVSSSGQGVSSTRLLRGFELPPLVFEEGSGCLLGRLFCFQSSIGVNSIACPGSRVSPVPLNRDLGALLLHWLDLAILICPVSLHPHTPLVVMMTDASGSVSFSPTG